jgi:hypothetical protein
MIAGLILFNFHQKIQPLYGYRTRQLYAELRKVDLKQRYAAIEMMKQGGGLTISACIRIFIPSTAKNSHALV